MPRQTKAQHDPASFNALAERLMRTAQSLHLLGQRGESLGIESIECTHNDQLLRGMKYVENFAHAARQQMYEVRRQRGDYCAGNGTGDASSCGNNHRRRGR